MLYRKKEAGRDGTAWPSNYESRQIRPMASMTLFHCDPERRVDLFSFTYFGLRYLHFECLDGIGPLSRRSSHNSDFPRGVLCAGSFLGQL